ncbi:MAG: nucleotidyl transferase AbiEii/AbiGii toxin family protein [Balneolaceae bacterium]|nr:nucleotidyl transferase AbiEii/AbiGii toxin family protein [Balneolaceae bacterium]
MIDLSNLTREWIQETADKEEADPQLIEKVNWALLLLEGLVKQELPFVFKGGTALMLHFDSTKRLSIDIDIVVPEKTNNLDEVVEKVVETQGFYKCERQDRESSSTIQKEHYKLYYEPVYNTGMHEDNVLLDILIEDHCYSKVISLPIQSRFVPISKKHLRVKTASIEDLLGDKLTAFAPETTGIPYYRGEDSMSLEIIKQLYDIGNLFDEAHDLEVVRRTFDCIAELELGYRDRSDISGSDVLDNIYMASLCVATRGADGRGDFRELNSGMQRINPYVFSESYHIEKAITDASKSAYLATILRSDEVEMVKFDEEEDMTDWTIEAPMNTKLNKLKKSDPEAFFYWYKIYKIRE